MANQKTITHPVIRVKQSADDPIFLCSTGEIGQVFNIGTSDPINLCQGFALFPDTDVRTGIAQNDQTTTVLNTDPTILLWKFSAKAGYTLFMGVCGPAYALLFSVPKLQWADADGRQQVQMQVSDDDLQAGFFVGFTIDLNLNFSIKESVAVHWYTPWKRKWEKKFSFNFDLKFDLINLILTVILKILEEDGKTDTFLQKVNNITPNLLGTWGMFDEKKNQFAGNAGTLEVDPAFTVPINLVPYIPGLSEIDKGLQAILGYLRAGPSVGISIPTTVTLDKINIDGNAYPISNVGSSGNVTAEGSDEIAATPETVGVELEHKPGFDIDFGVFAAVGVLKLFNLSASYSFPVLGLLGITVSAGPFSNMLSTSIDNTETAMNENPLVAEVILEL